MHRSCADISRVFNFRRRFNNNLSNWDMSNVVEMAAAAALFGKANVHGTGLVKRGDLLMALESESSLTGSIGRFANVRELEEALNAMDKDVEEAVSELEFVSLVRHAVGSSDGHGANGTRTTTVADASPNTVWATPSDAPDVELSAVASFVVGLVTKAGRRPSLCLWCGV